MSDLSRKELDMSSVRVADISAQTFGKYQFCTQHDGVWYSDEDFVFEDNEYRPKRGAVPSPREKSRTPFVPRRQNAIASSLTEAPSAGIIRPDFGVDVIFGVLFLIIATVAFVLLMALA